VYSAKQIRNPDKFTAKLQLIYYKYYWQNTAKKSATCFSLTVDPILIVLLKLSKIRHLEMEGSGLPRNKSGGPRPMRPPGSATYDHCSIVRFIWSDKLLTIEDAKLEHLKFAILFTIADMFWVRKTRQIHVIRGYRN